MTGSVVTLGETMALLTPPTTGRLRAGTSLTVGIGGAESNVAIALARLGVNATWVSRLGDDDLGAAVRRELRAEGVTVRAATDPQAPTGTMLKEMRDGRPWRVRYYRAGSAASRLSPDDVDAAADVIAAAQVLHLSGITPALGPGPRAAAERAVAIARAAGVTVSVDVNHRRALWPDAAAAPVLASMVGSADLVFASAEEAAVVLGTDRGRDAPVSDGETLVAALAHLGPATAVVKLGALGAVAVSAGRAFHAPTRPVEVVDAVGAGDAFVGGYLTALVDGGDVEECLRLGNTLGGIVCGVPGDWEGLPTRDELDRSHHRDDDIVR